LSCTPTLITARYADATKADELRFFFITSDFSFAPLQPRPDDAVAVVLEDGEAMSRQL
jgi:isoleucyl-tRNA synthetase